jgi:hypothetical protein
MMSRTQTLAACGLMLAAGAALAGCDFNNPAPQSKSGTDVAGGLDVKPPEMPQITPPAATPAETPLTAPPCRSGDLSVRRLAADAGAGQRQVTYAFVNNGPAACGLRGYPTLVAFDADGKRLDDLQMVQTEANYFNTGGPPMEVVLNPAGRAVFFISFTGIQATDRPCQAVARLQITPPGNTQAIELQDTLQPCTGEVRLTPMRSFASASGVGASLGM